MLKDPKYRLNDALCEHRANAILFRLILFPISSILRTRGISTLSLLHNYIKVNAEYDTGL